MSVQAYKAHQSVLISSSLTFSQSNLQDYKHWTSALCALSVYLSAFSQCQIILLDDTDSGVQESVQHEHKSNTSRHVNRPSVQLSVVETYDKFITLGLCHQAV